jgi:Fur family peroxide stress response transcriptional regulator
MLFAQVVSRLQKVLAFGARRCRYDSNPGAHAHVVCTRCGSIADVAAPIAADMLAAVTQTTGYRISGHRMEWYGLCPACASASPSS